MARYSWFGSVELTTVLLAWSNPNQSFQEYYDTYPVNVPWFKPYYMPGYPLPVVVKRVYVGDGFLLYKTFFPRDFRSNGPLVQNLPSLRSTSVTYGEESFMEQPPGGCWLRWRSTRSCGLKTVTRQGGLKQELELFHRCLNGKLSG